MHQMCFVKVSELEWMRRDDIGGPNAFLCAQNYGPMIIFNNRTGQINRDGESSNDLSKYVHFSFSG